MDCFHKASRCSLQRWKARGSSDSCPDTSAMRQALCEERCWSGADVARGGGDGARFLVGGSACWRGLRQQSRIAHMSEAAGGSMAAAGQHVSSRGAQVKSVKWSCCRARRRSRYVDDDTQQLGSHQQWQIGRATAQRSCAVSGQLKRMAERTGIIAALLGAARLVCCAQITADRYCLRSRLTR